MMDQSRQLLPAHQVGIREKRKFEMNMRAPRSGQDKVRQEVVIQWI